MAELNPSVTAASDYDDALRKKNVARATSSIPNIPRRPPMNAKEVCLEARAHVGRHSLYHGIPMFDVPDTRITPLQDPTYSHLYFTNSDPNDDHFNISQDEEWVGHLPMMVKTLEADTRGSLNDSIREFFKSHQIDIEHEVASSLLVCISNHIDLKQDDLPNYGEKESLGTESFIIRANRLAFIGSIQAALDIIYDYVDELLCNGEFSKLDEELSAVDTKDISVDILIGILTATLPAKNKLLSREHLFKSVKQVLIVRGEYEDDLLLGLEG